VPALPSEAVFVVVAARVSCEALPELFPELHFAALFDLALGLPLCVPSLRSLSYSWCLCGLPKTLLESRCWSSADVSECWLCRNLHLVGVARVLRVWLP
jgi:hypothetical protein